MIAGPSVDRSIELALAEDIGLGDVTTRATVEPGARGRARVVARQDLVVAGLPVFARVFELLDPDVELESLVADGDRTPAGAELVRLSGPLVPILEGERVALNFLQRLSGVATLTRRYVDAVPAGRSTTVVDTRKTTPGLRELERYAVRVGGGRNHRPRLDGGILIKENHIAACGSLAQAVERARASQGPALRLEVEVRSLDELAEALSAGADVVMLDNMDLATTRRAMDLARGKVLVEVSGRVGPSRLPALAELGVDFVSVGALTHSAPAVDLSLLVESC